MIEILRSRRLLAFVAGMQKLNDHAEPTKVKRLQNKKRQCLRCKKKYTDSSIFSERSIYISQDDDHINMFTINCVMSEDINCGQHQ